MPVHCYEIIRHLVAKDIWESNVVELLFAEDEREVFLYIQDRYDVWNFDEEWEKRGEVIPDEEELTEASKEDLEKRYQEEKRLWEFELVEAQGDDIYEISPSFASPVRSSLQVGIVGAPQPRCQYQVCGQGYSWADKGPVNPAEQKVLSKFVAVAKR